MSNEVLQLLLDLLGQVSISAGDPELVAKAALLAQARSELLEHLERNLSPADAMANAGGETHNL